MPRLIDADKLPKYTGYALSADEVAMAVENAPTVDAEPVRHGHWIFSQDDAEGTCSCCQYHIYGKPYNGKYLITPYNYCPNCGSKMDEVIDGAN